MEGKSFRPFSSPELRSFWPPPRIESSGWTESRKSANHGLPAFCAASEIWNNNGYHRLQKWSVIALACYPGPRQSSRSVALAKRIAALGTRKLFVLQLCLPYMSFVFSVLLFLYESAQTQYNIFIHVPGCVFQFTYSSTRLVKLSNDSSVKNVISFEYKSLINNKKRNKKGAI